MGSSKHLRDTAISVAADLAAKDSVTAVLLVGSVATGYADEYSDIDLHVVGSAEAGERTIDGVHVEWTPTTHREISQKLNRWNDDAALYTYATADVLYDQTDITTLLAAYKTYPPAVWREKLYAGWFYGSGSTFDARKAASREDSRVLHCATTEAVEQFAALCYVLTKRFPPYRKWLFRDLPLDLPAVDEALLGNMDALDELMGYIESELRGILDDERIEKPYLHNPEFDKIE